LQIPNADRAVIEPAKLHEYLLSRIHAVCRFNAFFLALGYSPENWPQLEADLRSQHLSKDALPEEPSPDRTGRSMRSAPRWLDQRGARQRL